MKQLTLLLLTCTLVSLNGISQEGTIKVSGKFLEGLLSENKTELSENRKSKPLKDVSVFLHSTTEKRKQLELNRKSSAYELELPANDIFTLTFSKDGFLDKLIEINTNGASEEFLAKRYELRTDITLFKTNHTASLENYSKFPVAICSFDKEEESMIWDMEHAQNTFQRFMRILKEDKGSFLTDTETISEETEMIRELDLINAMTLSLHKTHHVLMAENKFETKRKLNEPIPAEASAE